MHGGTGVSDHARLVAAIRHYYAWDDPERIPLLWVKQGPHKTKVAFGWAGDSSARAILDMPTKGLLAQIEEMEARPRGDHPVGNLWPGENA